METVIDTPPVEVQGSQSERHQKFKLSFKESKLKIKCWEEEFMAINNRKPDKHDIKDAPENVRVAHKNCYKIKEYFAKTFARKEVSDDSQNIDMAMNMSDSNTINMATSTAMNLSRLYIPGLYCI